MEVLVEWSDGKRPLGRTCLKGNVNIRMSFKEVGCVGIVWIWQEPVIFPGRNLLHRVNP
jgi:hypothetical protein